MKRILSLVSLCLLLFISALSQDNLQVDVLSKVNLERVTNNLEPVCSVESLELASAQHGCWLAMYNRFTDVDQISLPEIESSLKMIPTFFTIEDRVRNFSYYKFENLSEFRFSFYKEPSSSDIWQVLKWQFLEEKTKNIGFWVVKFEDKELKPIWYLVFLKSN